MSTRGSALCVIGLTRMRRKISSISALRQQTFPIKRKHESSLSNPGGENKAGLRCSDILMKTQPTRLPLQGHRESKMLARLSGARIYARAHDSNRLRRVAVIGALFTSSAAHAQPNIEQIVTQKVQPILPKTGTGGGVAVAVRMNGKTSLFNYGMADNAQNRPITADSIFNLGSVGKVFATTLLAQAVKQGELSLDDPVAKYVTELQRGGDIRRITLGQLASHSSGLPNRPQEYETWHRGRYTWPDFVRFLNSWKAGPNHEPGQQYLYSDSAMVLLRVALERRFNTRFAALMHQ